MKPRSRTIASLLALISFVVYVFTLAPDMLLGDSGEFQFAAPFLSIVHPTGYPLYLILANLFTLLPLGTVAMRVNLFSAACAALAVSACYVAGLQQVDDRVSPIARHAAAIIAALVLAFSPAYWLQATQAEVYTLNSLLVLALIVLAARLRARPAGATDGIAFAAVFGLALAHHRTVLVLLPALLAFVIVGTGPLNIQSIIKDQKSKILLALCAPLLLYLYTPLRYGATPYTHIVLDAQHVITTLDDTPNAFVAHALGTGFSGALFWDGVSTQRLLETSMRIVTQFGLLGLALALLGLLFMVRTRQWASCALLVGTIMSFALFNAAYHIGDIADYYTPLFIATALLSAQGLCALGRVHTGLTLAAFVLPLALLIGNWPLMQQHEDVRAHWTSLLAASVPANAVLLSNDRDEMTPLFYLQLVEHIRPDLIGLFPLISSDARLSNVVVLTQYALETSRPVYFVKSMDSLNVKFRLRDEGQTQRVLGLQTFAPQHDLSRQSAYLTFLGWSHEDAAGETSPDGKSSVLVISLVWKVTSGGPPALKTYVHVEDAAGRTVAQSDQTPGGEFYPPSQWPAGETIHDEHRITMPPSVASADYRLVAGAYLASGDALPGVSRIELGTLRLPP